MTIKLHRVLSKQIKTWKFIADHLQKNVAVTLLYVLESKRSSPGRQGFFMAVNANGEMQGSIGGGIMEHKFIEMARKELGNIEQGILNIEQGIKNEEGGTIADRKKYNALKKQIHDKAAKKHQSGMICSGEQTIWIYFLRKEDELPIQNMIASLKENKNGTLSLSPSGIGFSNAIPEKDFYFDMQTEEHWQYREKTGYKNHLFIIGGGHCSLALCKIMSQMDFYIHVFDEREQLPLLAENEFAHEKKIIPSYEVLKDLIPSAENHYIVIMTVGYRTDKIALRALMEKDFKYIGLLGSKNKIKNLFDELRKEGISKDIIKKIHSPIGIHVKSETPEEIAVSIAAEIIGVKNKAASSS